MEDKADGAHSEASHNYMIPILSLARFSCKHSFSCRKDIRIPQAYYTYYGYYEEALVVRLMTRILRKRHISAHSENGWQKRYYTDPVTQSEYGLCAASRMAREVTGSVIS